MGVGEEWSERGGEGEAERDGDWRGNIGELNKKLNKVSASMRGDVREVDKEDQEWRKELGNARL